MRTFEKRLTIAFGVLISTILAGLGIIIGQLFPIFIEVELKEEMSTALSEIKNYATHNGIEMSESDYRSLKNFIIDDYDIYNHSNVPNDIWFLLLILVVGTIFISIIISTQMVKKYAEPIDRVTETAMELAKGNYKVRVTEGNSNRRDKLSASINILARNLQDISVIRKIEEERLKTLIENMGSALMMIGRGGNISVVNRSFLKQFEFEFDKVNNVLFRTVGLPQEVVEFIDYVFMTEKTFRKHLRIEVEHEVLHMDVYGAPVIGDHGRWLGVVVVMHDITELIRLEQIRKDFVANVSHELKTPITSIKGFSETLLDGALNDKQTLVDFLEIIHKESDRLQLLIQDLLELSRIEQHGFSINIHKVDIKTVIDRAVEMNAQRLEEKEMKLNVDMKDVIVDADMDRLIQIVMNLIANAITYSQPNTTINVKVYTSSPYAVIEVKDEGIGIEQKELPRIFERFYRVDRARSRNSGGTGLGLAIVKHLVEAHDGKINVFSKAGKGTTFKISIPIEHKKK